MLILGSLDQCSLVVASIRSGEMVDDILLKLDRELIEAHLSQGFRGKISEVP